VTRVLVTGGAGFIGSHLAERLLAEGYELRALDNLDPQVHPKRERPDYLSAEIDLRVGDVRDRDAVARALAGCDAVVHLAAAVGVGQSMYEIERYTSVNAVGCAVLLEEVAGRRDRIAKVLVASSNTVYGEGLYADPTSQGAAVAPGLRPNEQLERAVWDVVTEDGTPLLPTATPEDKPLGPTSVYAIGKRDQEELTLAVCAAYGIPAVALRFFSGYGPRQALSNPYTGVVAIFASRLKNGRAPLVFEDGRQTRDFVHVSDIARACALALESDGADGTAVNVGTGTPVSVLDVAGALQRGLGVQIEPHILGEFRAGDIRHCFADTSRAESLLGFRAEIDFEDGVGELLDWLAAEEAVDDVERAYEELAARKLAR
jgi:dTDP-L-rhamnose 4-epimerase